LRALIEAELSGFASRYRLNGVPVIATGAFAQQFALVIHELATNAAKHGALSSPAGRVLVDWHIDATGQDALLHFCWVERGGPPVSAPSEFGFGSRLLAVASSHEPRISFASEGLEFHLDVPFSDVIGATKHG
jgi:two-component sensor histidine kinase